MKVINVIAIIVISVFIFGLFGQSVGKDKSPFPIPKMQSVFHRHAQRNAFHRRGVHQRSTIDPPFTSKVKLKDGEATEPLVEASGGRELVSRNAAKNVGLSPILKEGASTTS